MSITIDQLHASWIRALSLPSLIGATAIPGPRVGTLTGYLDAFAAATASSATWRRPWEADSSFSRLWQRNLGRVANYSTVDGAKAWKRMVPLWGKAPGLEWRGQGSGKVSAERFLLPGAVAVVVTAELHGPLDFAGALNAVVAADERAVHAFTGGQAMKLPQLLDKLLADCQRDVLGTLDGNAVGDNEPLSVVTVIRASSDHEDSGAVAQDNAVHRLLHGFCSFNAGALAHPVPAALDKASLPQSARSDGSTLLAYHRGRAVWSPYKLLQLPSDAKLTCYHHNLVTASALAEGLLAFVLDSTAPTSGQSGRDIAKQAVNVLGMLYGPAKDMWSSASIRKQIDNSGAVPTINAIRRSYQWADLAARTPAA